MGGEAIDKREEALLIVRDQLTEKLKDMRNLIKKLADYFKSKQT